MPWDATIGDYLSTEDEPLNLDEWKLLAEWLQYRPEMVGRLALQGHTALCDAVRVEHLKIEQKAALLLARNPALTLQDAYRLAKPTLSGAPEWRH